MKYCVNCGKQYEELSGVCPSCYLDQTIPEALIDSELGNRKARSFVSNDLPIDYPGEQTALRLAIIASLGVTAILGALSLGTFFFILALSLIHLRISHVTAKRNMFKVSEQSFARVLRLIKVGAYRLRLPAPEVYVTQDPAYNAFTMGFGRFGFIVINSGLVENFSPRELLFVIGHEMGHIKRFHTTWLNLTAPGRAGFSRFLFGPLMNTIFNVWSLKSEYSADQAGLIACDDLAGASTALLKTAGGSAVEREVDLHAILGDEKEPEEILSSLVELLHTHPFIQNRVKHLTLFASSRQYRLGRWWEAVGRSER